VELEEKDLITVNLWGSEQLCRQLEY